MLMYVMDHMYTHYQVTTVSNKAVRVMGKISTGKNFDRKKNEIIIIYKMGH